MQSPRRLQGGGKKGALAAQNAAPALRPCRPFFTVFEALPPQREKPPRACGVFPSPQARGGQSP